VLPKVIIHNSVSLDGSLTNFKPDMGLHYKIAGGFKPQAHLVGSNTVRVGAEVYGDQLVAEAEADFEKPNRPKDLPYWVIPDSKGMLRGFLHTCRRFEFCRDVVVLLSEKTPNSYVEYLKERNYAYHVVGKDQVDLRGSLEFLASEYKVKRVLVDAGRILGNLLLEQGLVSEISLLVHPVVVGEKSYGVFGNICSIVNLRLFRHQVFPKGLVWLRYKIGNRLA
jgi:2,5-diamino-6-(ribosylamino)-4(3H)-pyrimidinone 5'-phosphate reductase